jgi:hypothetical protein
LQPRLTVHEALLDVEIDVGGLLRLELALQALEVVLATAIRALLAGGQQVCSPLLRAIAKLVHPPAGAARQRGRRRRQRRQLAPALPATLHAAADRWC